MTHPFHPLAGQEFELLEHRNTWDEDRVFYREESGRLRSLPAAWTSVVPEDAFVTLAAGRCPFRLEDLRALAALVGQMQADRNRGSDEGRKGDYAADVRTMLPRFYGG